MRAALIVLMIFNLALLAALKIRFSGADVEAGPPGLHSEKISIVPMREDIRVMARCVELGPLSAQEAVAARQMLEERSLADLVSSVESSLSDGWWVFIPPRATRAEALKRTKELEKLGVRDWHVFEDGPSKFAISLGVFRSQAAADEYRVDLARRGVQGAKTGRQTQRVTTTSLYVRSQVPEIIARVTEVKAQFARAELRQVSCPEGAHTAASAATR